MPFSSLDIDVTTRCNLACRYCFKAERKDAPGAGREIEWRVARRAIRWFIRQAREQKLTVQFMGAEPLLAVEMIERVMREGSKVAAAKGVEIRFGGATNCTLIDDRVMALVKPPGGGHGLELNLSLDGMPVAHDMNRVFEGGAGSSRLALEGASKYLAVRSGEVRMTVTPETAHMMAGGVAFLRTLVSRIHAEPDYAAAWDERALSCLAGAYREAANHYCLAMSQGAPFYLGPLEKAMLHVRAARRPEVSCRAAGRNMVAVDVDGNLWACHRFVGVHFKIGDVFTGADEGALAPLRSYETRYDCSPPGGGSCCDCPAVFVCAGCCPVVCWEKSGDIKRPPAAYCEIQKIVAREATRAFYFVSHDDAAGKHFEAHLKRPGQPALAGGKPCC